MSTSTASFTEPLPIKCKQNLGTTTVSKSRLGGSKKVTTDNFKLTPSKMLKLEQSLGIDLAPVDLNHFDINNMQWSSSVTRLYFSIESEAIGKGALREAYEVTSNADNFMISSG